MVGVYVVFGLSDDCEDAFIEGVFETPIGALSHMAKEDGYLCVSFLEIFGRGEDRDYFNLFEMGDDIVDIAGGVSSEVKDLIKRFASEKDLGTFEDILISVEGEELRAVEELFESFLVDGWEKEIDGLTLRDDPGYTRLEFHALQ